MSIASSTTTKTTQSNSSSKDKSSSSSSIVHHNPQHFVNERYPRTCLEDIPSIMLQYPPRKVDVQPTRSRNSLRYRTQPVTLTEINEHDEENKNDNHTEQESQINIREDFQRLEHLALSESIRRTARKKLPTKNYLERQRLKAMSEESTETDGN